MKGSAKVGDLVAHEGKIVYVSHVLDYDPEMRKSYIKCCVLDTNNGNPRFNTNILAGYDWDMFMECRKFKDMK